MSLELVDVTHRFGRQVALEGVTLGVQGGDCYGFIGHNGSGKTTAMRIALGLMRPDSGRVLVDGFDARRHPREARARMGGFGDETGFHPGWDGARNLEALGRLRGLSRSEARDDGSRLLELVGLGDVGRKAVGHYSQGMRQRLGIAQALLSRPRYVLLDEPTNGLDPEGIVEIRSLLRSLVDEEGVTVLLSSHQLQEVSGLCNRVGVLHQGRLLLEDETRSLLAARTRRYVVRTDDDEGAAELLSGSGFEAASRPDGGLVVELGERDSDELARAVLDGGRELRAFSPESTTLEEIYLRFTHGGGEAASPPDAEERPEPGAPSERHAKGFLLHRPVRYELGRLLRRARLPLLLLVPALAGAVTILERYREALEHTRQLAEKEVASVTQANAFEAVAIGMGALLPVLMLIVTGFASQSIAGELERGTLRNVLLCPLRRTEVAAGKLCGLLAGALGGYAVLCGVILLLAGAFFDFKGWVEVLPKGLVIELEPTAEQLWPELWKTLALPLAGLAAYVGIGFLAGAACRTGVAALALGLGLVVVLDLGRAFAARLGFEAWLPSSHLPSPLGDRSVVAYLGDLAQGASNADLRFADTVLTAPLVWFAGTVLLATALLLRRSVP